MTTQPLINAQALADLRVPPPQVTGMRKTAVQVARRVFQLAASGGHPYKYHTPESWARKWLKSKEFVLMEIDVNAAACVHQPKHPEGVAHYMRCSIESMDPIVVDGNKRKMGRTALGYIPEVVVHDGKHRLKAQKDQGRTRVMAWVGKRIVDKMRSRGAYEISASAFKKFQHGVKGMTKFETMYELYASTINAAMVPSTGLANTVTRQSTGESGSRPRSAPGIKAKKKVKGAGGAGGAGGASTGGGSGSNPQRFGIMSKKVKAEDCNACGARSSGSLNESSASDDKVPPDQSDTKTWVDPSDRRDFDPKKPNLRAPGTKPNHADQFGLNKAAAYGSNIGPRIPNGGATKSDFSRGKLLNAMGHEKECHCSVCAAGMKGGGIKVKKIYMKAPPGREDQVLELKKKYGEGSPIPFQIAWDQYQQGKNKD